MTELFEKIEKFLEHEGAFYDQPQPFVDEEGDHTEESTPYNNKLDEMFFNLYDKVDGSMINEIRYEDYANDTTKSTRQKINTQVAEIDAMCRRIEQMLVHCIKLKKQTQSDQNVFWKPTFQRFSKIANRLNKIKNQTLELST